MTRWERHRGPQKQWVPTGRVRFPSADDAPASGVGNAAVAAEDVLDEEAAVAVRGEGAVPALEEAVHDAEFGCGLSGVEQEAATQKCDDTRMKRFPSVTTLNDGDSIWSDAAVAPVHDDAAVAAGDDGDAVTRRSTR